MCRLFFAISCTFQSVHVPFLSTAFLFVFSYTCYTFPVTLFVLSSLLLYFPFHPIGDFPFALYLLFLLRSFSVCTFHFAIFLYVPCHANFAFHFRFVVRRLSLALARSLLHYLYVSISKYLLFCFLLNVPFYVLFVFSVIVMVMTIFKEAP